MIEKIIQFSIKNKAVVGVFTGILIIWGVWSATKLPIDALPDITNNQVQIYTVSPTLAGQEVEQFVTFPIEQSLRSLPNLKEIRSISRFGLSVVTVVFDDNMDIYFCRQLVNERLKEAEEEIPKEFGTPRLVAVSTGLGEIYQYIIHPKKGSEKKYSPADLREIQDWIVARQLIGTEGVAEVNSFGGKLKQYEVAVNPYQLQSMNVSISEIFDALEENNQNTGGAYIEKNPNAYFIRGIGLLTSLEDIRNIAVKRLENGTPIFIRDVADVRFGSAIRYGAMTLNGKEEVVGGVVMMLKGENSNEVVQRVKNKVIEIQKTLPEDVVVEPFLERTDLVGRAIQTVEKNLLEGALIVIFVLVVFLGNLRAGFIVASAIPLSLLFALGLMNVFGVSANLMSLGAIDFGLIIDGAVIITEATLHLISSKGITRKWTQPEMDDMVEQSAGKMMRSAVFGQIIILIVYIPILSLVGVEGKMFRPMAQTVSFAIIGATLLSLTYIPMMCSLFLSKKPSSNRQNFSHRMILFLQQKYQPLLLNAIRWRKQWIIATLSLFFVALFLFKKMGGEFIPQLQEGDFAYHCILPQGSSLTQSIQTSMQASRMIKEFDEVKAVIGKTGSAEVPTDPMPPEVSDLVITLKPKNEWKRSISYEELAKEISAKLENIPGVYFESNQPIQMRFNELMTGVRQDVAVKIFGENLDSLAIYAQKVGKIIQSMQGVSLPQIEQTKGLPQINVRYDRTRLANYGLNVHDVNDALSTAFAGKSTGKIYENERSFDVVVRLDTVFRHQLSDVENLLLALPNGTQIPLSQVATIRMEDGPTQISREDGKRRIVIGFNAEERDIQSVVEEIQQKLEQQIQLPTSYYFTYGGQFQNLQEATARLSIAVPVALLLIFIILYFTFHSFKEALLIFTAIPMSAIGGVFLLWLRDMPFSISAGIGFIALFGVAVLNGIVLISTFNQLEKEGWTDVVQRIVEGTKIRLRPVLMTATVASFGFLPMALSTSAGAEVQKPLATVVIGGLVSATFLTLFVLPLLYLFFHSKKRPKKEMVKTVLLALLLTSGGFINAQTSPKTIRLEEAVELAIQNNGNIKAGNLEIQAAEKRIHSAGDIPNLEINSQFGQNNGLERNDNAFEISQTIPFPTLFVAQKRLYQAELSEKKAENTLQKITLIHQVKSIYYQIRFLTENQNQLKHLDSLYLHFSQITATRFQSGEGEAVEIGTAKAKRGEIQLLLQQNQSSLQQAYSRLASLLRIKESFVIQSSPFEPLQIPQLIDTSKINEHPYLQMLIQEIEIAKQRVSVEKSTALPDIHLGYTNQSFIGFHDANGQSIYFDAGKRFHSFQVGISVPLAFGANRAKIKSERLRQSALEEKISQEKAELATELQNAVLQYQQNLSRFEYYQKNALPNAEQLEQTGRLNYQTGNTTYFEYLFILKTVAETRLNYLKSIQEANETALQIIYFIQ